MSVRFESKLLQVGAEYKKRASRAVDRTAKRIGKIAQGNAPVRTGNLKNSLQIEVSYLAAFVGFTAEYAAYVNYGTRRQAANPFFTAAMFQAAAVFEEELKAELR